MTERTVYMIGHSAYSFGDFRLLLERHAIKTLIDVRIRPVSTFCPQFNGDHLAVALASFGITYAPLPALGGKHPRPIKEQWDIVAELDLEPGTCLMCAEADFRVCHRHFTLTNLFRSAGYTVLQILPDGSTVIDNGPTADTLRENARFLPAGLLDEDSPIQTNLFA